MQVVRVGADLAGHALLLGDGLLADLVLHGAGEGLGLLDGLVLELAGLLLGGLTEVLGLGLGVLGHLLMFLSLALMYALGALMPLGWAALIVAVLWGVVAAVLALQGKKNMEKIKGLPQTQETVQEIPGTLNPAKETR